MSAKQPVSAALSLRRVSKNFGGISALQDLAIEIPTGEIHGLIGPNGAGKTTAINIATGFYRPDGGSVWMFDREVSLLPPQERGALGFSRTFQNARPFGNLDVRTNLLIAVEQRRRHEGRSIQGPELQEEVDTWMESAGLQHSADVQAKLLPYGQQKQLEITRALSFARTVLLLDEPTAGLSEGEIANIISMVTRHRATLAILLVEHNMDVVMAQCDRVTVIDAGRWLATGTPADVQSDPTVIAAYLGS